MPNRLEIMHVISGDLWAGAESQLFNLVRAQKERGESNLRVVVFNKGLLYEKLCALGVPVTFVCESRKSVIGMLTAIRREIKGAIPLIVHTHGFKEDILVAAARIGCRLTRLVRTVHGMPERAIRGLMLKRRMVRWLESLLVYRYNDMIVLVSSAMDEEMAALIPSNRRAMVNNGIDCRSLVCDRTKPETTERKESYQIGFFGRLVPVKRLDLLIQVFEEVSKQLVKPVSFVIVGGGPEMRNLKKLVSKSGIKDDIDIVGFRQNVVDLMSKVDAIILTSDHEGLPMVCLEALCLGVPIVSRKVGDVPQLIFEHDAGTTVDTDDPVKIAHAVVAVLQSDCKRFGPAPLKTKYTAIGMEREYQKVYERLIGRSVVLM